MHPRSASVPWAVQRLYCWGRRAQRLFSTSVPLTARQPSAPFRMAVVGAGPAGFYAASRVLSKLPGARVDMYESLPVPFGLVRHGVAPDHPEVKNCQNRFDEVASSPGFRFIGNVSVGRPARLTDQCSIPLSSLTHHYDSILLAYGAAEDNKVGIPGESTLGGIYPARKFVGWYNGLPDFASLEPDLTAGCEAIVIGNGNVALDIARILLTDIDALRKTDITEHALAQLARSQIKRVHVIGRRGPVQASFTIKEVRELLKLQNVAFHPVDRSLIPDDLKSLPRAPRRLMELLMKGSPLCKHQAQRSWSLEFCLSPTKFTAKRDQPTKVGSTDFNETRLEAPFDPKSPISITRKLRTIPSSLVICSVGYRSSSLLGFDEAGILFDERRGLLSSDGLGRALRRVADLETTSPSLQRIPGIYCTGWVKNGPTGVIASTMQDAFATGDAIVKDWLSGDRFLQGDREGAVEGWEAAKRDAGLDVSRTVSWDQWRKIDLAERERGKKFGKEREKFTTTADMLSTIQ